MPILYASLLMLSLVLPGGNGHGLCVLLHSSIIKKIGIILMVCFHDHTGWSLSTKNRFHSSLYPQMEHSDGHTFGVLFLGMRCELTVYYVIHQWILICSYSEIIGLMFLRWDWISKWKDFKASRRTNEVCFQQYHHHSVIIMQGQSWLM